jgi:undecaprenyl-diphosphatase
MTQAVDGKILPGISLAYERRGLFTGYPRSNWLAWLLAALPILAIAAVAVDGRVAAWVFHQGLPPILKHSIWAKIIKGYGHFGESTIPIAVFVLLAAGKKVGRYAAAWLLLNGIPVGLFYTFIKWFVGRPRPYANKESANPLEFHPLVNGLRGLWHAPNLSFPSGHTCLAFATATTLSILWPRGAWLFFLGAVLVGAERVLENAHYPSDVFAGAFLGIIAAWITQELLRMMDHSPADATSVAP